MDSSVIGIIALYKPQKSEINNIEKYIEDLDYCYLADDSGEDNLGIFADFIERYEGKVEYYANPENLGLCGSVNNAITKAINRGADWVLIMNPDGTFSTDAVKVYKKYLKDNNSDDIAIIAPVFNIDRHPRQAGSGTREISYADMTGCLYSTKVMNRIGLFDPKTYFYGLDSEYCLRVKKIGYRIIECLEAVLDHCPAKTREIKLFDKRVFAYGYDPPDRFYYQFRSAYYIHQKYGLNRTDFFMIYKLVKVVLFFENKKDYFQSIRKGIRDAKDEYYGKRQL